MATHAAERAAPGDEYGDAVAAVVAAARRRLRFVLAVHAASLAVPGSIAAGAAIAIAGAAPWWTSIVLGAGAVAGSAVWAALRTPTVAAVAGQLDAALGLRDRVTAAQQLRGSTAPIAALVSRDAAARLAGVRPAAVFPLALARAAVPISALAVALSGWLAVSGRAVTNPRSAVGVPRTTSTGASDDGRAIRQAGTGSVTGVSSRGITASPDAAATARENGGQTETNRHPENGAAPARAESESPSVATRSSARVAPSDLAGTTPQASGSAAAAAAARSASLGSAAGAVPTHDATGAGGVSRGGALTPVDAGEPSVPVSADRYAAARAGAEAALARDVIPPAYRDDVRAYFRTLAPGGAR
jgi:hypothetical protein